MIFRKNEPVVTKVSNAAKSQMAPAGRREPELTMTPPPVPTTSVTPPISPLTAAQNRRPGNTQTSPAASYGRTDQQRKLTVGRDISLNGEITTCDHLVVEGTVKATIKGGQMLEIAETGTFTGTVDIEQADIAGVFEGELSVRGKLVIRPTAMVTGIIRYGRLQVDTGASINGSISTLSETRFADVPSNTNSTSTAAYATAHETSAPAAATNSLSAWNSEPGFMKAAG